jgi:hypothetical protein
LQGSKNVLLTVSAASQLETAADLIEQWLHTGCKDVSLKRSVASQLEIAATALREWVDTLEDQEVTH